MLERRAAAGVTLVELMVGMTLSLFIAAALGTLVVNMSRAHRELDRSSRQIENGRYAIDLLAEEIRAAGYYADARQVPVTFTLPNPCSTALADLGWTAAPARVPTPLEGRTGGAGTVPACVTDHTADTAILLLHRLSSQLVAPAAVNGTDAYVQSSQCSTDPAPPVVISASAADFTLQNRACDAVTAVRRIMSRIYFVSSCNECGSDTIPTLKRLDLTGGVLQQTALAEGIEEIQYEYGFDTDNDGSPDQFLTEPDGVVGSALNDWSNVMAVRVWLLSRSTEETRGYQDTKTYELGAHGTRGPYNDQFKRRAYTTLVRLNNPIGWRE
jgi:type IV pilus assembly protein PilW